MKFKFVGIPFFFPNNTLICSSVHWLWLFTLQWFLFFNFLYFSILFNSFQVFILFNRFIFHINAQIYTSKYKTFLYEQCERYILPLQLTIVSSTDPDDLSTTSTQESKGLVHLAFNVNPLTPNLDSSNSTNPSESSYMPDARSVL